MRVILTNASDLHVLAVVDLVQAVVLNELEDGIRSDVPRLRNSNVAQNLGIVRRTTQDLHGQEQAGPLATKLPLAA
jgi:hypothetical protein